MFLHIFAVTTFPSRLYCHRALESTPKDTSPDCDWLSFMQLNSFLCLLKSNPQFISSSTSLELLFSKPDLPDHIVSLLYGILRRETSKMNPLFMDKWEACLNRTVSTDNWQKCLIFTHKLSISSFVSLLTSVDLLHMFPSLPKTGGVGRVKVLFFIYSGDIA